MSGYQPKHRADGPAETGAVTTFPVVHPKHRAEPKRPGWTAIVLDRL